jgi:O-antigen/teichoic acid export membrane protein
VGVIRRQGIKNTIITYVGILIGAVNMIFIQPRFLTEEELGLTRLLYFCAYLIGILVPAGLPSIIIKFFPFIKDESKRHQGFMGFVILAFLIGFAICGTALLLLRDPVTAIYEDNSPLFAGYFLFLIPFTFIVSAISVATTYCQSLFKSTVPAFLNDVCARLGIAAVTIMYFNKWLSFDGYVWTYIGVYAVELIILIGFIISVDRVSLRIRKEVFERVSLSAMLPFGLVMCAASFASYGLRTVDAIILGETSLGLVGVYTTAVFVASFIEVPLGALERITHTKVADHYSRFEMDAISRIYKESVNYLLVAGGFLFVGLNACTRHLYEIGGLPESYFSCINVVYIVGLGALVNVSTGVNSAVLFYSQHYLRGTVFMVLTLIITVLLNLWLIPIYGIYGAALASLSGVVIYNFTKFLMIWVRFGFQPYSGRSLGVCALILLCVALAHLLPEFTASAMVNFLYKGGVSCSAYLLLLVYFKLAPAELGFVKEKLAAIMGRS